MISWAARPASARLGRPAGAPGWGVRLAPGDGRPAGGTRDGFDALTPREREVVESVVRQRGAKGLSIAGSLGISENTLRNHLSLIYEKLGVRNRIDLYAWALERGVGAGT